MLNLSTQANYQKCLDKNNEQTKKKLQILLENIICKFYQQLKKVTFNAI